MGRSLRKSTSLSEKIRKDNSRGRILMTDDFGFAVRSMTKKEQLYCYTQSMQLRGQTGCIGYLRADMDTNGEAFFSSWNDFDRQRNTQGFKDDLDLVIRTLRSQDSAIHFLKDRSSLADWCFRHPDAAIDNHYNYGFRVDTESYTYMMRLNPNKGEYNLYCYCYTKDLLDRHMAEAERGIRFINSNYKDLFRISDGDKIRITYRDGSKEDYVCRYIDPTHLEVGGGSCNLFHICEFAEHMESANATVEPIDESEKTHKARSISR